MRFVLSLVLITTLCSGCFRRFVQSDKQIREYFSTKPVKPTYFTIADDSVQLFCATAGADTLPPLLIVHGAPGAWYGSRNILADTQLTNRFHVISVDRPGYHKSRFKGKRKAVTSISTQAVAIQEAMRLNRSHRKGIIMGSSYGGPIAARIAMDHPEEFYHVVLLAAAVDPGNEQFFWFNKWVHHGPLRWLLPHYFKTATDEKYSHVAELQLLSTRWHSLQVPVTALQGDADHIVKPVNLEYVKKVLAGKQASFMLLPGVDHLIRWQRADLVKSILLDSLPHK